MFLPPQRSNLAPWAGCAVSSKCRSRSSRAAFSEPVEWRHRPGFRRKRIMARKRVPKLTQTEKAYTTIKRGILQGEIPEGAFLVESEVLSRYGIGRTPYREACNRLIHEGLLDAVPRRGYMVPEIPFHTVCDTFGSSADPRSGDCRTGHAACR